MNFVLEVSNVQTLPKFSVTTNTKNSYNGSTPDTPGDADKFNKQSPENGNQEKENNQCMSMQPWMSPISNHFLKGQPLLRQKIDKMGQLQKQQQMLTKGILLSSENWNQEKPNNLCIRILWSSLQHPTAF